MGLFTGIGDFFRGAFGEDAEEKKRRKQREAQAAAQARANQKQQQIKQQAVQQQKSQQVAQLFGPKPAPTVAPKPKPAPRPAPKVTPPPVIPTVIPARPTGLPLNSDGKVDLTHLKTVQKGVPVDPNSVQGKVNRAIDTAASSTARVATGIVKDTSGAIDLLTPGKGTSRVTKALLKDTKQIDEAAKKGHYEQGYRRLNVPLEVASYFLPGKVVTGGAKASTKVAKTLSVADDLVETVANKLGTNAGKARKIVAEGIRRGMKPEEILTDVAITAKYMGSNTAAGNDTTPGSVAFNVLTSLFGNTGAQVLAGGAKQLFKKGVEEADQLAKQAAKELPKDIKSETQYLDDLRKTANDPTTPEELKARTEAAIKDIEERRQAAEVVKKTADAPTDQIDQQIKRVAAEEDRKINEYVAAHPELTPQQVEVVRAAAKKRVDDLIAELRKSQAASTEAVTSQADQTGKVIADQQAVNEEVAAQQAARTNPDPATVVEDKPLNGDPELTANNAYGRDDGTGRSTTDFIAEQNRRIEDAKENPLSRIFRLLKEQAYDPLATFAKYDVKGAVGDESIQSLMRRMTNPQQAIEQRMKNVIVLPNGHSDSLWNIIKKYGKTEGAKAQEFANYRMFKDELWRVTAGGQEPALRVSPEDMAAFIARYEAQHPDAILDNAVLREFALRNLKERAAAGIDSQAIYEASAKNPYYSPRTRATSQNKDLKMSHTGGFGTTAKSTAARTGADVAMSPLDLYQLDARNTEIGVLKNKLGENFYNRSQAGDAGFTTDIDPNVAVAHREAGQKFQDLRGYLGQLRELRDQLKNQKNLTKASLASATTKAKNLEDQAIAKMREALAKAAKEPEDVLHDVAARDPRYEAEAAAIKERYGKDRIITAEDANPGVFDSQTEVGQINRILENKDTVGTGEKIADYYRNAKGVDWYVTRMTPDEYLDRAARTMGMNTPEEIEAWKRAPMGDADQYLKDMQKGDKFPMAWIDERSGSQEGRTRALAAKAAGQKEMPVAYGRFYDPANPTPRDLPELDVTPKVLTPAEKRAQMKYELDQLEQKYPDPNITTRQELLNLANSLDSDQFTPAQLAEQATTLRTQIPDLADRLEVLKAQLGQTRSDVGEVKDAASQAWADLVDTTQHKTDFSGNVWTFKVDGEAGRGTAPAELAAEMSKLMEFAKPGSQANLLLRGTQAVGSATKAFWTGAFAPVWQTLNVAKNFGLMLHNGNWLDAVGPNAINGFVQGLVPISPKTQAFISGLKMRGASYENLTQSAAMRNMVADDIAARANVGTYLLRNPVHTLKDLYHMTSSVYTHVANAQRHAMAYSAYKRAVSAGVPEDRAMHMAVEEITKVFGDLQRVSEMAQALEPLIPYAGATQAGVRALVNKAKTSPAEFAVKQAAIVGGATAFTLYSMGNSAEYYKDQIEKGFTNDLDNNFVIVLPGASQDEDGNWSGIVKIPVTPDFRALNKATWRSVYNRATGQGIDPKMIAGQLFNEFTGDLVPNVYNKKPVEASGNPLMGVFSGSPVLNTGKIIAGVNPTTGEPLSDSDMSLRPRTEQAYDTTSSAARSLSDAIGGGLTPIQIDKMLSQLGNTGRAVKNMDNGNSLWANFFDFKGAVTGGKGTTAKQEDTQQYFDNLETVEKTIDPKDRATLKAFQAMHSKKTAMEKDNMLNSATKANQFMQYSGDGSFRVTKLFEAEKMLDDIQRQQGKAGNPLFDLPAQQLQKVLMYRSLKAANAAGQNFSKGGESAFTALGLDDKWYDDFREAENAYYKTLPGGDTDGKRKSFSGKQEVQLTDEQKKLQNQYFALPAKSAERRAFLAANPWLKDYWAADNEFTDQERKALGFDSLNGDDVYDGKTASNGYGGYGGGSYDPAMHVNTLGELTNFTGSVKRLDPIEVAAMPQLQKMLAALQSKGGGGRAKPKLGASSSGR